MSCVNTARKVENLYNCAMLDKREIHKYDQCRKALKFIITQRCYFL
jgi:hypothetical protein